jgi:hypothetical protein
VTSFARRFAGSTPLFVLAILASLSFLAWKRSHRSFAGLSGDELAILSDPAPPLPWSALRSARFTSARIRIPGFVIPLEGVGIVPDEFLLVPTRACLHTQTPPANQTILVKLHQGARVSEGHVEFGRAVWVFGVVTQRAGARAEYELHTDRIEAYDP